MPILSEVGRRHWKVRLLIAGIYLLLIAGSITTVYPFLVMVNGSVSGTIDIDEFNIFPSYLLDDTALYRQYLFVKYAREPRFLRTWHQRDYRLDDKGEIRLRRRGLPTSDFHEAIPPEVDCNSPQVRQRIADYEEYMIAIRNPMFRSSYFWGRGTRQEEANFVGNPWFEQRYGGDIQAYNKRHGEFQQTFLNMGFPFSGRLRWIERDCRYPISEFFFEVLELPESNWTKHQRLMCARPIASQYDFYLEERYGKIAEYNHTHGTDYASFLEVPLTERMPDSDPARQDWIDYVKRPRNGLSFFYMRIDVTPETSALYREYLRGKYASIDELNNAYRKRSLVARDELLPDHEPGAITRERYDYWLRVLREEQMPGFLDIPRWDYRSFEEVELSPVLPDPEDVPVGEDWRDFVEKILPPQFIAVHAADQAYAQYLINKYGTLDNLNHTYGTAYRSFPAVRPPIRERDWTDFSARKDWYRRYFLYRNYKQVFEHLRQANVPIIRNTIVLCLSMIFAALTINPLAAFALSRFGLSYTYKVLLFCLATMAFPAEVTMIPNFLLIKQFGMLNTYWAIILPGVASGFSIFLFKGFFDSLPEELFEAARIEGCSELGMFWRIAVPLSKPIFAVIALGAFMAAYGSFMWALVVCQNPRMWTLMVWLYEFQQIFEPDAVMAALVLAAIPTLVVFILCQKVILKGIIVPTFK